MPTRRPRRGGPPDVTFLYLPLSWYDLDYRILLLRAWLEHRGIATAELIRRDRESLRAFVERAARTNSGTMVVHLGWWGAHFGTLQRRWTFGFLEAARARMPETAFVACGEAAAWAPAQVLRRSPAMDGCVTGDPFAVLAAIARQPRDRLEAAGLATRAAPRGPGAPADPAFGPGPSLDAIPSPFRGLANAGNYDFTYSTALGCSYACSYCRTRAYDGTVVRAFGVDRVLDDLERIARLYTRRPELPGGGRRAASLKGALLPYDGPVGGLSIEDQTFTLDRARTLSICDRLRDRPVGVPLGCVTRADLLDDELIEALWSAGFRGIGIGVDAIDPGVLRRSGRLRRLDGVTERLAGPREYVARAARAIARARDRGFAIAVSGVVGLPGSTTECDQELVSWLADTGCRVQVNPFISNPRPLARQRRFEDALPDARLEELETPRLFAASHFAGRTDTLLREIDASRPSRPSPLPVAVVASGPVPIGRLASSVSSGAHVFALAPQAQAPAIRASVAPLPAFCLVERDARPSEDADERFELSSRRVPLSRLVDARGGLRLGSLAVPRRHPLVDRHDGVCVVETGGAAGLAALARFTRAARKGLTVALPPGIAGALVLVVDGCAVCPGAAPAPPLRRIWVDPEAVRACPAGPVLGAPGASAARLAAAQRRWSEEAKARRGCARCPAVDVCPACPCGAGLADAEYCRCLKGFGRLGPAPVSVLGLLPAAAEMLDQLEPAEGERTVHWASVPARAVLPKELCRAWARLGPDGEAFARAPAHAIVAGGGAGARRILVGRGGAVEVPVPLADALRRAQQGRDPCEVAGQLAKDAEVSGRAARQALRSLLETRARIAAVPVGAS